jgi:hypothetical protein
MTKSKELSLFDAVIAETSLRGTSLKLKEVVESNNFLPMFNAAIIAMRGELRSKLLDTKDSAEVAVVYADFYKDIQEFYKEHYDIIKYMYEVMSLEEGVKAIQFMKWYLHNKIFIPYKTGVMHNNEYAELDFELRVGLFKSAWNVFLFEVSEPLHKKMPMVEIAKTTKIEEEDWDGKKEKIGIEIIRRSSECGGIIISFAYVEDLPKDKGKMFYFYAVSPDGKENRYYKQKLLK